MKKKNEWKEEKKRFRKFRGDVVIYPRVKIIDGLGTRRAVIKREAEVAINVT